MVCADISPDIPYLGILGGGFGVERKEIKGTLQKLIHLSDMEEIH